jgi:hypothetical protein
LAAILVGIQDGVSYYFYEAMEMLGDMAGMIESNTSYRDYVIGGQPPTGEDRISLGSAFLAVLGLSALGWAIVLAPFFMLIH